MKHTQKNTPKNVQKKSAGKQQLPVSKKFYAELRERVANACGLVMKGYEQVSVMMAVIDAYLFSGAEPSKDADRDTILIFALLRPEMDRALRRSAAARNRKRKCNDSKPEDPAEEMVSRLRELFERHFEGLGTENEADDDATAAAVERPMNRRERRRFEQELKRSARKAARSLQKQAGVAVG